MTPRQRDAIAKFAAFQQADMSTTRKFGGTGLGLYISSAMSRLLGGGLEVESSCGKGTVFTVRLNVTCPEGTDLWGPGEVLPDPAESRQPNVKVGLPELSLAGAKILLAEDGTDNQRLIAHHVRKAGAEIEVCENGREAVDRITELPLDKLPDLILMDMQMPELDGYEATRELRRRGFSLPIVALTAHAMEGDRKKCLKAGCDDYVTKPINRGALVAICARFAVEGNQGSATLPKAAFCNVEDGRLSRPTSETG
jgi:CheY-like chemotaxis protein